MPERLYRTQILLEPGQQRALGEIARRENRSVSDLIRMIVRDELDRRAQATETTQRRQLAAIDQIRQHREEIALCRGGEPLAIEVAELIAVMREERDADNLANG